MLKRMLLILLALGGVSVSASAKEAVARDIVMDGCKMQENLTVNVNFNMTADSLAEARKKLDEKMQQIGVFAKQNNIPPEPQSMNYNINSQRYNNNQGYQVNGSISHKVDSEDAAFKFAEFLDKQGFNVSLNSNSYRQGNCR